MSKIKCFVGQLNRTGDNWGSNEKIFLITPDIQIASAIKIVEKRNFIIHAYDSINNKMIWTVVPD